MALVQDSEERLRAASRSPVDVYAPGVEEERFVSNHTGTYWPYRWTTMDSVVERKKAVAQGADRCESLRLDLGPGARNWSIHDLCDAAAETGADEIVPRPLSSGTHQIDELTKDYSQYDFRTRPRLCVPVGLPYSNIISTMEDVLTRMADRYRSPPDVALMGVVGLNGDHLVEEIREVRQVVGGDVNIHLLDAQPTIDLASTIRWEPGLIDSISVAEPDDDRTVEKEGLSTRGRRDLSATRDTVIETVADFSLLCSTYISKNEFYRAAHQSALPATPITG